MSVRRLAPEDIQPPSFALSPQNQAWAEREIAKYPAGRQSSAVIPLLWQAQKQAGGWLSRAAIEHVAQVLDMPRIRVLEVATFYTMFNLEPVGRHYVQLCGTTPCALRGAEALKKICRDKIGPQKEVTADGAFSWLEVECLGACCNAPMVQINDQFYEDLTPESFAKLLDDLAAGRPGKPGPQNGRRGSEPEGSVTTLADPSLYDGSRLGEWRNRFEPATGAAAPAAELPFARGAAAPPPAPPAASAAAPKPPPAPSAQSAVASTRPAGAAAARPQGGPASGAAADTPGAGGRATDAKGSAGRAAADKARAGAAASAAGQPLAKAVHPPLVTEAAAPIAAALATDTAKPQLLAAARGGAPDDLKLIWGVGPKLEAMLHRMGVFHFDQIAAWTAENLKWVDRNLAGFRGRAERDDWIGQSKKLAGGWRPERDIGDGPKA